MRAGVNSSFKPVKKLTLTVSWSIKFFDVDKILFLFTFIALIFAGSRHPSYSTKIFLGGVPWDINEDSLMQVRDGQKEWTFKGIVS
jgi:hypothetical protein